MNRTLFHVVCRECPTESLRDSRREAETVADDHTASTDHDVAVGRVEAPSRRATLGNVE